MSGGAAPELDVRNSADNADIGDGSTTITAALGTDFGTVNVGSNATNSFRAENNGTSALTFGADALAISNTTDFQITADLTNSGTVASSGVNTFSIRFNPASGGTKTATVTIRSDDDDEDPYTFSIRGTGNAVPTADAGIAQSVASGTQVTLSGSGSDADGTIAGYSWTRTGGTGDAGNISLSSATAQSPSFTDSSLTSNDSAVTHVFDLVVTDDDGATSVADSVTITITPPDNAAPLAVAGPDQSVVSGTQVTLSGSGSDADGTIAGYSWTRTGGTGDAGNISLSSATAQSPSFTDSSLTSNDSAVTHVFDLVVTDDDGATSVADSVTITITPPDNAAPLAVAGPDQSVVSGTQVTLSGSGSDADGTIAGYSWTRTGGTGDAGNVSLSSATAQSPSFTDSSLTSNDSAVTHVFDLVVTDDDGATSVADSVTITITPPDNAAPLAVAGPDQSVVSGTQVTLSGSGSDADGTIAGYSWTRTGGTGDAGNVSLSSATAQSPSFTDSSLTSNDSAVTHVFDLVVTDDDGATSVADSVTITITPPDNAAPLAVAGPDQSVVSGTQVTLSGSGSDADGTIAGYSWTRTGGTGDAGNVSLSSATAQSPSFTDSSLTSNDSAVTHVFDLVVTDDDGATSVADSVTITITPPDNAAPLAVAGPDQSVVSGTQVTLSGSGSDADGTIAGYSWTRTGGTGDAGNVSLSSATAQSPSFTDSSLTSNDSAVTHVFDLVVTDDDGATSVADSVTITITPPDNAAPLAVAGPDQSVVSGTQVTLSGSGSDADGTIAGYSWTRTGGTGDAGNVSLSSATAQSPSFTDSSLTSNDSAVTHVFDLVVTDDDGATSVADSVTITITPPDNAAPLAVAGPDQSVVSGTQVTLSGSGSDADGTIAGYSWTRTGGTGDAGNVSLSSATAQSPSFTDSSLTSNDSAVTHVFDLVVTDDDGATSVADSVTITITPPDNAAPLAVAGPDQSVVSGTQVTLSGSGSDADGTIAGYSWTRTGGTGDAGNVSLSSATAQSPSFTDSSLTSNDSAVTHVFDLVVTDDDGATSVADSVTITITPPDNAAPLAVAGPDQSVVSGTQVTLSGSGSDADGTIAGYSWTRTGGTGDAGNISLSSATAQSPSFTDSSLTSNDSAVTHVFDLVVTDDDGATSVADSVTITITPPDNAAPLAVAGPDQSVVSGTQVTLSGSGSDADGTIAGYAWTRTGGTGDAGNISLSSATAQSPSFTDSSLTSNDSAVTHVFDLVVTDDDGATSVADSVTITITPPDNAAPLAVAGPDQSVVSGTQVTLSGSGSDADGTIAGYAWTRTGGTGDAGNISLSSATAQSPSFTDSSLTSNDSAVTHVFDLVVTDDDGATSVADSVTITITPPDNAAPLAVAGPDQSVVSGTQVTLSGSGSDADGTIAGYSWTRTGGTGDAGNVSLSSATAQSPSFTDSSLTSNDSAVTHVFDLVVTDDDGATSVADSVTITITPPDNAAPLAVAGPDQSVVSGTQVTLSGSGSDADGTIAGYSWTRTGGTGDAGNVSLSSATAQSPSFTDSSLTSNDSAVTHVFDLVVTDDDGATSVADSVTITITPPDNAAPLAVAGPDQSVVSGTQVTLSGSGSDADGTIAGYSWTRTGGTGDAGNVSLSSATAQSPSFTDSSLTSNDSAVTHVFDLVVTDDDGATSVADSVTITITPPDNAAPLAVAGPDQSVVSGTQVTLSGSGSDADGTIAGYAWTRTGGTGDAGNVSLSSATAQSPSFTDSSLTSNDSAVTHVFDLVVTDDDGATSVADSVTITITPPDNAAPLAVAGPDQSVVSGTQVTLSGSGSDADGTIAGYSWTRTGGTGDAGNVSLSSATAQSPSFTDSSLTSNDSAVTHVFDLVVTDDDGATSVADSVTITITPPDNAAPLAVAGPDQSVVSGTQVTLSGSGSDADGTIAGYSWTRTGGTGDAGNVSLSSATAQSPSFTDSSLTSNDSAVTHVFDLVVTDDDGATSVADSVTITITPPDNAAPLAVAGPDQSVVSGTQVTLSGSGSDADGTIAGYSWTRTGGTGDAGNISLSSATAQSPSFTDSSLTSNDSAVTHVFDLVVTDDDGATSVADSVTITITPPDNAAPLAVAGPDQSVVSGTQVTLSGSGSDADGTIAGYSWTRTGGTGDAGNISLSSATAQNPSFTDSSLTSNDSAVTHVFDLVVTDDDGATSVADSVTITITPPPDTEAPVIAGIGDIAVDTDPGVNTASVVLTATITDNSGETILPTFSIDGTVITSPFDFPVGATTVVVDAQDSAGNAAVQQSFVVSVTDTTPPEEPVVVTLTATSDSHVDLSGTVEPGSTVTVTFPDGSTQSVTADASTGAFTVTSDTPQQSGVITIVATDVAMNDSDPTEVDFIGDDTSPTISIGTLSGPTNGTYTAVITLSEDSSDFDASDLTLANATATLSGGGSSYTATVTPDSDGAVTLSVAAGTFTDPAGNSNDASNTVSAVYDGTAPTVSISGAPDALEGEGAFTLNITFSEPVTGFTAADISSTNAIVTGVSGSDASYIANLRASGTGDVQVSVPANVAADAAGNGNLASNLVVISDFTIERTQELIASYMQTRANQLLLNQPDLMSFLSGSPRGEFYFVATPETGNLDFASNANSPVWAQASASWTNNGDSRSEYVFGALGAHRTVNENLLVGAMLQFDHLNEDTGSASIGGTGWMVGPYFVARSAVQPLYFEGRLLYGESDNDVSPFGTYEDSVDTTRLLAQLKVAGELAYGATTLSPFVDASYTTDDQDSYIDSLGNPIPEQGITLGQIEVGMDFSVMVPVNTEELELWGGVSGIWSHTSGSGYASTVTPDYDGGRARVELGINHQISMDQSFTAGTYYDGIGVSDYESYGLSLGYQMQF
ncbi:PKD domain-containing protein [Pontivivens nitratireducens]|uniref:Uncharacterized protein n=1 Tax=Pontivivens nitratireducens TaxID=2758038 RepID=A0A6G7VRA2_9RHOB|nr:hypothetical protein [Pontibrevibacter nitratireducens]QIK42569.1 hypothetical protein G8E03_17130 [Pontibrevibacter nitratireducens]